jgi:hypothetical protein
MQRKDKFLDAKNALFMIRLLNRLEQERNTNTIVDTIISDVERANGYKDRCPLINQTTFLAFAYTSLVYLKEDFFRPKTKAAQAISPRMKEFLRNINPSIERGKQASPIGPDHPIEFLRRTRNALAHSRVEIAADVFVLHDKSHQRNKGDDWVQISLSWADLGRLMEEVVFAVSDYLTPPGNKQDERSE